MLTVFKKSKLNISLDQQSEVSSSLYLLYVEVENYQNILKLQASGFYLTKNVFKKEKEILN